MSEVVFPLPAAVNTVRDQFVFWQLLRNTNAHKQQVAFK